MNNRLIMQEFNLYETGGFQNQFRKPFELSVNSNHSMVYDEATDGGTRNNMDAIAKIAASAINISAVPEKVFGTADGSVPIAGDWGGNRARFVITMRDNISANCSRIFHYIGWTDHLGWVSRGTQSTAIDNDMRLYFNQVIELHELTQMRNGVPFKHTSIVRNDQFLSGTFIPNANVNGQLVNDFSIRPCEILDQLGATSIMNHSLDSGSFIIPTHTGFQNKVKHSESVNTRPVGWLSKILTAGISENDNAHLDRSINTRSSRRASETELSEEPLFLVLPREMLRTNGFFTYGMFLAAFQGLDDIVVCHQQDHVGWYGASDKSQSSAFNSATLEGRVASILQATLPGIAVETLFRRMYFRYSNNNRTMENQLTFIPMPILPGENSARPSFEGIVSDFDVRLQWDLFCRRFEAEVIPLATANGTQIVDFTVDFSVTGDIRTTVSVNNNPMPEDFRSPSYINSLSSSLLTNDSNRIVKHSTDLSNLTNAYGTTLALNSISGNAWEESSYTVDAQPLYSPSKVVTNFDAVDRFTAPAIQPNQPSQPQQFNINSGARWG